MKTINTDDFSAHLREKAIELTSKKVLITNFENSKQVEDLTVPPNCKGFGRIRHFKLGGGKGWPQNPLPIFPAAKALGVQPTSEIRAQVFQNAACNWRCWYCFVDFKLLGAKAQFSDFLTCDQMLELYLDQPDPPPMIDLTGGQPDLTPEWIPWMMEALMEKGLDKTVYLWSDDNLSNDYFWRFLTPKQIDLVTAYERYARVCCFKGIDEESFSLNTKAEPKVFSRQFDLCKRLTGLKIDLYFYITLTASTNTKFEKAIPEFLDRVQEIDVNIPLRTVPLEVTEFSPVKARMKETEKDLMAGQYRAIKIWQKELARRFTDEQLEMSITDVALTY